MEVGHRNVGATGQLTKSSARFQKIAPIHDTHYVTTGGQGVSADGQFIHHTHHTTHDGDNPT